nr:hypothetical protein [uncultured Brachyspira sp.]
MVDKINKIPSAFKGLALGTSGIFNAWTIFTGIKYLPIHGL